MKLLRPLCAFVKVINLVIFSDLTTEKYNLLIGLQEASEACCALTPYGTCDGKRPPCKDRKSYVFFDAYHPTEAAYKILAQNCFNGVGACVPLNIQQLASI